MSRTTATRPDVLASPNKKTESAKPKEGHRETVEAIVVAMILALLVRGFEAEAFVIPTGSMAPTLMGRHKEITCPQCGFVYAINASDEVEGGAPGNASGRRVHSGICVNCRFQAREHVEDAPSFKGDRILVMKFPYDLPFLPGSSSPQRWDVVVFRYPEEPEVSYIKRLVGLPGEELSIYFGDIFLRQPGSKEYQLARKPLAHLQAMQMMVYDDTHRASALEKRPEWRRWTPSTPGTGWTEVIDPAAAPGHFKFTPASSKGQDLTSWSELRYRNLVPDPEQWEALRDGGVSPRPPRASLITAFYSYNTNLTTAESSRLIDYPRDDQAGAWMKGEWVGDLSISARLTVNSPAGKVRFELVEAGVLNHCSIDLATGKATLYHDNAVIGEQTCPINEPGAYDVNFANIDDRLTLIVDGRGIFGDGVTYEGPEKHLPPTAADLAPVAIAAQGAEIELSDLVLKRDIYYTLHPGLSDYRELLEQRSPRTPVEMFDLLSDTAQFEALGNLRWSGPYLIGPQSFMMLGDNSPRSKDGRGWDNHDRYDPDHPEYGGWDTSNRSSWEVPRGLLTGKAFFVYWPHGKPIGPDIRPKPDFQVPFRPYIERMKWIR